MDWKNAKDWALLIVMLVQGLGLWIQWSLSRKFVSRSECEACHRGIDAKVSALLTESAVVQARSEEAPSGTDLAGLETAIEAVRGDVKQLAASIAGQGELIRNLTKMTNLLFEHHMKGDR